MQLKFGILADYVNVASGGSVDAAIYDFQAVAHRKKKPLISGERLKFP
ncbi:hypothetical protein ACR6A7_16080 [Pantoea sp. RRHST58]